MSTKPSKPKPAAQPIDAQNILQWLSEAGEPDAVVSIYGEELRWTLMSRGGEKHLACLTGYTTWPLAEKAVAILQSNLKSMCAEQRLDASGANDDEVMVVAVSEAIECQITRLEDAQALPELISDAAHHCGRATFADGAIQRFKDADGRTMVVVAFDGALAKMDAPT